MHSSLLKYLRCPFCGGALNERNSERNGEEISYGVLTCYCNRYPVIAGIAILKKEPKAVLSELISLAGMGLREQALLLAVAPPESPALAPGWIRSLPSVKGINRLKYLAHMGALPLWRKKAIDLLMNRKRNVTARDLLAFFFSTDKEAFNYFAFRFGQPRHLVALSFASIIQQPSKPILDLACGFGHITRSLTLRVGGQPVFGLDESFRGLYLAKHWIAPDATYVCCSADAGLPFADGSFEAVFCSDAFHYFVSKKPAVQELKRLTRESGLLILSWVHNALFRMPHDGLPLPPEGYQELFADMPSRMVPDHHVLGRYLKKQGPALSQPTDFTLLAKAPLLSIVASHRQNLFQDYGAFVDWPHAEGRLKVNPLFMKQQEDRNGRVILRRTYPSAFYEADHAESNNYLPERVELQQEIMDDPEHFRRTPTIDRLIEKCVVLSMPEHYQ